MEERAIVEVIQWPAGRKGWDIRLRLPGVEDIYLTPWFRTLGEANAAADAIRDALRKVQ